MRQQRLQQEREQERQHHEQQQEQERQHREQQQDQERQLWEQQQELFFSRPKLSQFLQHFGVKEAIFISMHITFFREFSSMTVPNIVV